MGTAPRSRKLPTCTELWHVDFGSPRHGDGLQVKVQVWLLSLLSHFTDEALRSRRLCVGSSSV